LKEGSTTELRIRVSELLSGLPFGLLELLVRLEEEPWLEARDMNVLELERSNVGWEVPVLGFAFPEGMDMVVML
jgi:hypothetical protein